MKTIKPDPSDMYKAIGEGITIWANIEFQLAVLFCYCTGNKSGEAFDAFYAIQVFNSKLNVVNAAAKTKLKYSEKPEKLKVWQRLNSQIEEKAKTRNKLAHFVMRMAIDREDLSRTEWKLGRPHIPFSAKPDELKKFLSASLSLDDVKAFVESFKVLMRDLSKFNESNEKNLGLQLSMTQVLRFSNLFDEDAAEENRQKPNEKRPHHKPRPEGTENLDS